MKISLSCSEVRREAEALAVREEKRVFTALLRT
jgi:hypothetical protein